MQEVDGRNTFSSGLFDENKTHSPLDVLPSSLIRKKRGEAAKLEGEETVARGGRRWHSLLLLLNGPRDEGGRRPKVENTVDGSWWSVLLRWSTDGGNTEEDSVGDGGSYGGRREG
jgi:hypothetical protein